MNNTAAATDRFDIAATFAAAAEEGMDENTYQPQPFAEIPAMEDEEFPY